MSTKPAPRSSQCRATTTQLLGPKSLKASTTYPGQQSLSDLPAKCTQNLPLPTTSTHSSHHHLFPGLPASAFASYSLCDPLKGSFLCLNTLVLSEALQSSLTSSYLPDSSPALSPFPFLGSSPPMGQTHCCPGASVLISSIQNALLPDTLLIPYVSAKLSPCL